MLIIVIQLSCSCSSYTILSRHVQNDNLRITLKERHHMLNVTFSSKKSTLFYLMFFGNTRLNDLPMIAAIQATLLTQYFEIRSLKPPELETYFVIHIMRLPLLESFQLRFLLSTEQHWIM